MAVAAKRRGTDWIAARDLWLAQLPPRSFGPIAKRFHVSTQRVGFVARRDNWQAIADKLDADALRKTTQRIVRSHSDRVTKTLGIIDAALDVYDTQLAEKAREAKLRDLGELARTAQLLAGEATERPDLGEVQQTYADLLQLGVQALTEGWSVSEFLAKVRELGGEIGDADAA